MSCELRAEYKESMSKVYNASSQPGEDSITYH